MDGGVHHPQITGTNINQQGKSSNTSSTVDFNIGLDDLPLLNASVGGKKQISANPSFDFANGATMAGEISASGLDQNSIPKHNLNINKKHINFEINSEDFPLLSAPSNAATGAKPSYFSGTTGGDVSGADSRINWLKGFSTSKDSSDSIKLAFSEYQQIDGEATAVFDSGELKPHITNCESYVVGYFVGRRPSFLVVKEALKAQWKIKGELSMTLYGAQAFFFNFVLNEDRDRVLELGSVYIEGKLFLIRPWSPFLEQNIGSLASVPIWINLFGIPMHLWNDMGFSRIASIVGKPIMTDTHTAQKTRLSFARICVEVDADCTYPSVLPYYIDKEKFEASVEYPWKPKACSLCKKFGHASVKCNLKPKFKAVWIPKGSFARDKDKDNAMVIGNEDGGGGLEDHTSFQSSPLEDPILMNEAGEETEKDSGVTEVLMENITPSRNGDYSVQGNEEEEEPSNFKNLTYSRNFKKAPRKEILADDATPCCVTVNSFALLEEEEETRNVNSEDSNRNSEDEESVVEKLKSLQDVNKYHPMDREKHMDKLMKFSSALNISHQGKEEEVKNVFSNIVDKYHKSRKERELQKLAFSKDTSDEQLGRGLRNSAKKK